MNDFSTEEEQFEFYVKTIDIPDLRKTSNQQNYRWFLRNAWIRNSEHCNLESATKLAKKLMKV